MYTLWIEFSEGKKKMCTYNHTTSKCLTINSFPMYLRSVKHAIEDPQHISSIIHNIMHMTTACE